ncbi:MAG: hypothetical protein NTW28_19350, partial [Candidatus Solibacter sp.]|nr:hypothetical protein [Candidatus Solibacter sp.]
DVAGLRPLAAAWNPGSGRRISVMVVNDAAAARVVTVRVPGGGRGALEEYHYFEQDRPTDRSGYPAPARRLPSADLARGVKIELPAQGVVFLATAGR